MMKIQNNKFNFSGNAMKRSSKQFSSIQLMVVMFALASATCNVQAQTLDDYVKIATENNPGLKSKQAMYEASLARIAQAKGLQDPTFTASTFGQMVETRVGQQMANFSIEQMFPWFGTLKAKGDVEALNAQAQFEEYRDAQNELVYKVRAAYYPLFEVDSLILLTEHNLGISNTFKVLATSRFQQGKSPMVDVLRTNILIEQMEVNIKILKLKKRSLLVAFNTLLNRGETEPVQVDSSLTIQEIPAAIMEDNISRNPKLIMLANKVKATQAQEALAHKMAMPMLGVGFNYSIVAKRPDMDFPGNGKDAYMPMLSVSLPIYRNKYKAMGLEASHMRMSYESSIEEEANQLISEYEMTSYEFHEAREMYHLYQHHVALVNQSIQLLLSAVESSNDGFEEILRMQSDKVMHETEMVKALVRAKTAEARLDYLTGKGL